MKNILLGLLSLLTSFVIVILIVVVGWFIVWKAFLSRFKFIRELLSANDNNENDSPAESPLPKPRSVTRRTRFKDD
ncbi:small integral membrane protein 13-like [Glandiceps talaboti]